MDMLSSSERQRLDDEGYLALEGLVERRASRRCERGWRICSRSPRKATPARSSWVDCSMRRASMPRGGTLGYSRRSGTSWATDTASRGSAHAACDRDTVNRRCMSTGVARAFAACGTRVTQSAPWSTSHTTTVPRVSCPARIASPGCSKAVSIRSSPTRQSDSSSALRERSSFSTSTAPFRGLQCVKRAAAGGIRELLSPGLAPAVAQSSPQPEPRDAGTP